MAKAVLKLKSELVEAMPLPVRSPSNVLVLPSKTAKARLQFTPNFKKLGAAFLPPLFVMLFALLMWQIFASSPTSGLPPPTTVLAESRDLIFHPFFDNGGTDKGLGLHVFASLKRVALGYSLAAIVGIALGTLVGASQLFMRGLDPLFQILRTVPPLAWLPISLAAFKDGQGALVSASRSILYAHRDKKYADISGDWQKCVERAVIDMKTDIAGVLNTRD